MKYQTNLGNVALVPTPFIPLNHFQVCALYHFNAEMDEEVTIEPGRLKLV